MVSTSSRSHQAAFFWEFIMAKRVLLFAGYSERNVIEDYVIYYIRKLSEYADIYFCADCDIPESELLKIKPYTKLAMAKRHKKYDFGSWGILYSQISNIEDYDELILANDSVFGPLYPLDKTFERIEELNVSACALCGNKFMMSFFVLLKPEVFKTPWFADFLTNIKDDIDKNDIVRLYEKGISRIVEEHGLKWDCLFSKHNLRNQIKDNRQFVREGLKTIPLSIRFWHKYRTNKTRVYDDDFFILFLLGMPFIKKQPFAMSSNHFNILAPLFIQKYTDYDYRYIDDYLRANNVKPVHKNWFHTLLDTLKKFFFEKKYKGRGIVYRVCKIKVYEKPHELV